MGLTMAWLLSGCVEATGPSFERTRTQAIGVLQMEHPAGSGVPSWGWQEHVTVRAPAWDVEPAGALTPPSSVVAPPEVDAGEPFEVRIWTIGRDGCWSPEGHVVHQGQGEVEIVPWDVHSGAEICTMVFTFLRHRVTLRLDEPGDWVIRVTGRRVRHGDRSWETPVTAETTVRVR